MRRYGRQREPAGFDFVDNHTPRHEACLLKTLNATAIFVLSNKFSFIHIWRHHDRRETRPSAPHGNNLSRYRRLLKTNLSDLERRFLERRLSEEKLAIESLDNGMAGQFATGVV
jgi:hypothetical protein